MALIEKKIKDKRLLALIAQILASSPANIGEFRFYPGDDLLTAQRPVGLPIGNLTSQLFANVYLNPLDYFIKRELKASAYLRYCDDFLIFG